MNNRCPRSDPWGTPCRKLGKLNKSKAEKFKFLAAVFFKFLFFWYTRTAPFRLKTPTEYSKYFTLLTHSLPAI